MQKDGKIVCADGNDLFRLNADGSNDLSFDTGIGPHSSSSLYDLEMQSTGKTVYVGSFAKFNNSVAGGLVRLTFTGAVDETFQIGSGADDDVVTVQVLENDELLISGYFDTFNGVTTQTPVVKLRANGALDTQFNQNIGDRDYNYPLLLKAFKGKIYLPSRGFSETETFYWIKRINSDGTADDDFYTSDKLDVNAINKLVFRHDAMFILGRSKEPGYDLEFMIKLIIDPVTAMEEEEDRTADVLVYPVPATDRIFVALKKQVSNDQKFTITVQDVLGKSVLKEKDLLPDQLKVEIETLPPGYYFLSVETHGFRSMPVKIVKR